MIELLNQINILSLKNPDKLDYIKSFLDENHDYWSLLRSVENKLITLPEIYKVFDNVTITYLYKNGYKKFISTLFATSSENDINWLMKYLLDNPILFKQYFNLISNFYSVVNDINYSLLIPLIKKLEENDMLSSLNYISISSENVYKLLQEDLSKEINHELIMSCLNDSDLNYLFSNPKNNQFILENLDFKNDIKDLLLRKIKINKELIENPIFFESIKVDSLVNFRNNINKALKSSYSENLENKLNNYELEILSHYDPSTKMFKEYNNYLYNPNYKVNENNFILDQNLYYCTDIPYLKELTSLKISEIIIDYLFKDNIYNVFINIREMLYFNNSLDKKILSNEMIAFYQTILNIDHIDNNSKLDLFYKIKDKKISFMYYSDLNKLKEYNYKNIRDELVKINDYEEDYILTNKYQVPVYDFRNKKFTLLVRALGSEFRETNLNKRDCYSLINQNNTATLHDNYIYGYDTFDINSIISILENDAYSSNIFECDTTINRLRNTSDIINTTIGINEIQIKNKRSVKSGFEALKPSYLICINNINEKSVLESKRLNIPIILVKENVILNETIIDNEGFYTSNDYIDFDEETERRNERCNNI